MRKNEKIRCQSCNEELGQNSVVFKCPSCGKRDITRCDHCRKVGVKYKCECGFEGP
ncbi:MAG: zinc finger domain-containing protein [Candidatus Pacearchaeota archaeon]|nr:zinc finger domain-containing protein [Candidatus Pacearchaeota archaeon]